MNDTTESAHSPSLPARRRAAWAAPLLLLNLLLLAGMPVAGAGPPGFAAALQRSLPLAFGVYGIEAEPLQAGDEPARSLAGPARVGAGFLIDAKGLAVTAAHVVVGSRRVAVKMADERVLEAEVIGADEESDIALVRLPVSLASAPVFGRTGALRAGDWVLAVGEPYGLASSVAAGIVGGKRRHFAEEPGMTYIQTDAALNPGNSGGPLLDADGAIVGMNVRTVVAAAGSPGVSLSIPIEVVLQIARELQGGSIVRPKLGAEFHDLSPVEALALGRAYAHGALIELVAVRSPAERAGLRSGDLVVGFEGRPIVGSADLALALLSWRRVPGTRFTVWRDGRYRQLVLTE